MPGGPSPERRDEASALLDEITFGGYSQDGAVNAVAVALDLAAAEARFADGARMAEAEESAVFDFLQWLAPQNIELHHLIPGGCSEAVDGELLERWKIERREG